MAIQEQTIRRTSHCASREARPRIRTAWNRHSSGRFFTSSLAFSGAPCTCFRISSSKSRVLQTPAGCERFGLVHTSQPRSGHSPPYTGIMNGIERESTLAGAFPRRFATDKLGTPPADALPSPPFAPTIHPFQGRTETSRVRRERYCDPCHSWGGHLQLEKTERQICNTKAVRCASSSASASVLGGRAVSSVGTKNGWIRRKAIPGRRLRVKQRYRCLYTATSSD